MNWSARKLSQRLVKSCCWKAAVLLSSQPDTYKYQTHLSLAHHLKAFAINEKRPIIISFMHLVKYSVTREPSLVKFQ